MQKLVSSLVDACPQAHVASLHSSYSQESHSGSVLMDESKENISPLRPKPCGSPDLKKLVNREMVGSYLLISEDMGTPLRRTTFAKDADNCSPKCVTRTPDRRIVSADGFHSSLSPKAVPDCYGTPLRRTTYVKNSPNWQPECRRGGHTESSFRVGKLPIESVEVGVGSHVAMDAIPTISATPGKTCRQCLKSDDPLRDVSRSPLILEDRLLHLQDARKSDKPNLERESSSVASSRCSPSESEYHTAVTTPFDDSLSGNEDADIFLDSNICSETITGDMSLCQQQLAVKASRDATFISNEDTEMDSNGIEDLIKKPKCDGPCVDCSQTDFILTSKEIEDEYEVSTEVISEVLMSDTYVTETITSLHAENVRSECSCTSTVCEQEVTGYEHAGHEQQLFHSARSSIQADDIRYNTDIFPTSCLSPLKDCDSTATGYDSYRRLSSTPVLNCEKLVGTGSTDHSGLPVVDHKLCYSVNNDIKVDFHEKMACFPASEKAHDGLFRFPFENDVSCSFNSQTFTKICATPSFTADALEDVDGYNRTYTKSANKNPVGNLSGSRPASRPLFTDSTACMNSADDEYTGFIPLDAAQPGSCDTAVGQPEIDEPVRLPKPELASCHQPVQMSSFWLGGETSVRGRDVFSYVGGQTRHMISPGQKRQSLIARLHGDGPQQLTQPAGVDVSAGVRCSKREHLEGDGSPARKCPLIATLKPCEY